MQHLFFTIISVIATSTMWGSTFVVTKRYNMGDGVLFQFLMSIGIVIVGLICLIVSSSPERISGDFSSFLSLHGFLGGLIWAAGNIFTVSIISRIGLGPGQSIWSGVNSIVGWLVGCYGLFGVHPEDLPKPWFGAMGLLLSAMGIYLITRLKSNTSSTTGISKTGTLLWNERFLLPVHLSPTTLRRTQSQSAVLPLLLNSSVSRSIDANEVETPAVNPNKYGEKLSLHKKQDLNYDNPEKFQHRRKLEGILMAIFVGILYGLNYVPMTLWRQEYESNIVNNNNNHNSTLLMGLSNNLQFSFSQFAGTFVTSVLYLLTYQMFIKTPSYIDSSGISPSILTGVMWGCASIGCMVVSSSGFLGLTVGQPLCNNGSFIINAMWSLFYYKEVQNQRLFFASILMITCGNIFIVLSKM